MSTSFIGIDNGSTGSIGIITPYAVFFFKTPAKKEPSYTKKKQNVTRVDFLSLVDTLDALATDTCRAMIERPFVNPKMFKSTLSGIRALEATLCALEHLNIGYEYIDSKEWQKALLPEGTTGTPALKEASAAIGKRLYPQFKEAIDKQKDADGLLIAHYLMTKYNK